MHLEDSDLIGTWFMSNLGVFPEEDGILVFRTDGICIQFPCSVSRPQLNQTFRFWYSCPDTNTLRFKMKPDEKGWFRSIERTDTGWTMVGTDEHGRKEFPCRIAKSDELPDWFQEMMDKNLAKMAALASKESTAEQAGTEQPAPRPETKSEGSDKPQPEAEGRSR